jgi:hypothetical protein
MPSYPSISTMGSMSPETISNTLAADLVSEPLPAGCDLILRRSAIRARKLNGEGAPVEYGAASANWEAISSRGRGVGDHR